MNPSLTADFVAIFHQLTSRLHASLDEMEVCEAIVRELCCVLDGDCAGLILYDFVGQTLTVSAAYDHPRISHPHTILAPVGLTLRMGTGLEQDACWSNPEPWVAQDVETARIPEVERLLLQAAGMHSTLMIPILADGRLLGTVYVGQTVSCRLWRSEEISLAKLAAEQAAIALTHARSYREAQCRAEREQSLNRISQGIRTSLDVDTTIDTALAELLRLTGAGLITFAVSLSSGTAHLKVTHAQSAVWQQRQHQRTILPPRQLWERHRESAISIGTCLNLEECGQNFVQHLLSQNAIVVANTQTFDISEHGRALFQQQQIGSLLSAPVWYQEKLLGHLTAIKQQPYEWTHDEVASVEAVANQLAIAIAHHQYYDELQRRAQEAKAQAEYLQTTLEELYATQAQLIQSEKMSSLGQTVAGVAHEINNPINFIYGNIPYIARYAEDLVAAINLYHHHYPHPPVAIAEFEEEVDVNFIKSDLLHILKSMKGGAERVREIVLTLRNFSRLDEAEMKSADVHEGLESTLLLLEHRLKPGIEVVRAYGDLPAVECYPGQLNQVFMNILSNAIDALTSRTNPAISRPRIQIRTALIDSQTIRIAIADNGMGIPSEYQTKIFDPFFTTKPVGEGTGLGLSISYKIIVQKHQGKLWFETVPHQGTEFVIDLPLYQACPVP